MRRTILSAAVACAFVIGGSALANDKSFKGDKSADKSGQYDKSMKGDHQSAVLGKEIQASDVPEAAMTTVHKKHPDGRVTSYHMGEQRSGATPTYVVALDEDSGGKTRKLELVLSNDGRIITEREVIAMSEIPDKVKQGFDKSRYGNWEVTQIEKAIRGERVESPQYQITVSQGSDLTRTIFDKDGKLVVAEKVAKASIPLDDSRRPRSTRPGSTSPTTPMDPGVNSPMDQGTNRPVAPDQTNRP